MLYESERVEYKSRMIDDICEEVIAFANTDGSVIYIGINDQGNVTGIDDVDETYTRLTNGIRDAIQPDVTMFVRCVLQDKIFVHDKGISPLKWNVRRVYASEAIDACDKCLVRGDKELCFHQARIRLPDSRKQGQT